MKLLIDVLEQQIKGYKELLALANTKTNVLISNNIDQLDQLNKTEQKLLVKLTKLENKRLQIIQTLQETTGVQPTFNTLKELASAAPEDEQGKFTIIYQEFEKIVSELDKINHENASLIQQALKYVSFTMDMLAKEDREVTYSQGDKEVKKQSRIFDHKV